jgi:hypothetical protein
VRELNRIIIFEIVFSLRVSSGLWLSLPVRRCQVQVITALTQHTIHSIRYATKPFTPPWSMRIHEECRMLLIECGRELNLRNLRRNQHKRNAAEADASVMELYEYSLPQRQNLHVFDHTHFIDSHVPLNSGIRCYLVSMQETQYLWRAHCGHDE